MKGGEGVTSEPGSDVDGEDRGRKVVLATVYQAESFRVCSYLVNPDNG